MKKIISFFIILFLSIFFGYSQTLDSSFGINGKVIHSFSNSYTASHQSCFLQNDGKILNVGYAYEGNYLSTILVTRHLSDGTLDTTFDNDGSLIFTYGQNYEEANSIMQLANDKIVVGGATFGNAVITMLNNDGSFDSSFGTNGKKFITTGQGNGSKIEKILQQPDGGILVFGRIHNGNDFDFMVSRLNIDGTFDETFGSNGIVMIPISNFHDFATDAAFQNDGKIVIAGHSTGSQDSISVIRINTNGTLDTTFATNGKYNAIFGSSMNEVNAVAIQPDGKIVLAGRVSGGIYNSIETLTIRLQTNGVLDTTFNENGYAAIDFNLNAQDSVGDVVILPNGEIIIMGSSNLNSDFALLKLNSNGTINTNFGTNGRFFTPIGNGQNSWINEAILLPNDDLILCGLATPDLGGKGQFGLVKVTEINLSTSNFENNSEILIYPNPTSDFIKIENIDISDNSKIEIFNIQGQKCFCKTNFIENTATIDISQLTEGVYILSIENNGQFKSYKICKK